MDFLPDSAPGPDSELLVGAIAPPLRVSEFVKGEPVSEIEHGVVHVIEFWSTWCGPCVETIPRLTALQARHPEVRVIGVAVWERDADHVRGFVAGMGDAMGYRVAVDAPAPPDAPGDPSDGQMVRTWLTPAYVAGVPYAMVVGADGCIAWSGYAAQLDSEDVAAIVAGRFDRDEAAARQKEEMDRELVRENFFLDARIKRVGRDDPQAALAAYDEAFAASPELERTSGAARLINLARVDPEAADAYADRLADIAADEPYGLMVLASEIAGAYGHGTPGPRLARKGLQIWARAREQGLRPAAEIAEIEAAIGFSVDAMDEQMEAMLWAAAGDGERASEHAGRAYAIAAESGADDDSLAAFRAHRDSLTPDNGPNAPMDNPGPER